MSTLDNDREEKFSAESERLELPNGYVKVWHKVGDKEVEVIGPEEYANQHTALFFSRLDGVQNSFEQKETPLLDKSNGAPSIITEDDQQHKDLLEFYLEKDPKDQTQEVVVITYYYQKFEGLEHLTLDDYSNAYKKLQKLAVHTPPTMKSAVRNVVDRTDYLYNPDRGMFQLTLQGERFVESLPLS